MNKNSTKRHNHILNTLDKWGLILQHFGLGLNRALGALGSSDGERPLFMGVFLLETNELKKLFSSLEHQRRAREYYILGTSLGPIIDIKNPEEFYTAFWELINEFFSHTNYIPEVKVALFENAFKHRELFLTPDPNAVYKYLHLENNPFGYDFSLVFGTFCRVLCTIFNRIFEYYSTSCQEKIASDHFEKYEAFFKKIIVDFQNDINSLIQKKVQNILQQITMPDSTFY